LLEVYKGLSTAVFCLDLVQQETSRSPRSSSYGPSSSVMESSTRSKYRGRCVAIRAAVWSRS